MGENQLLASGKMWLLVTQESVGRDFVGNGGVGSEPCLWLLGSLVVEYKVPSRVYILDGQGPGQAPG